MASERGACYILNNMLTTDGDSYQRSDYPSPETVCIFSFLCILEVLHMSSEEQVLRMSNPGFGFACTGRTLFVKRWIEREEPTTPWPPRSPDLAALHFFVTFKDYRIY